MTHHVANLDKITYTDNLEPPISVAALSRYHFYHVNICNADALGRVSSGLRPTVVMHLATESHMERSIDGLAEFIQTNMIGTCTLLESARRFWNGLAESAQAVFCFHHISTGEVYSDREGTDDPFTEAAPHVSIFLLPRELGRAGLERSGCGHSVADRSAARVDEGFEESTPQGSMLLSR